MDEINEIKQLEKKLKEMKRLEEEKRLDKMVHDSNYNIDFNLDILQDTLKERLCSRFHCDKQMVEYNLTQPFPKWFGMKPPSYFHNGHYIEYSTSRNPCSQHEHHTLYCLVKIFKILNMMNNDIKVLKETMI